MKSTPFLLMDLAGDTITPEEQEVLQHPSVAGVILFSRNFVCSSQLKALTASIRRVKSPTIIAVDQEGGRVQRFVQDFTRLPAMSYWGEQFQQNPEHARSSLAATIDTMAQELIEHGVNVDLMPVLDIRQATSEVIGERSFSVQPDLVSELASIVISRLHHQKLPSVGKHFPGHGGVSADSHDELPTDQRDWQALYSQDLQPFKQLAANLDAIMTAHIVYSKMDEQAATFSSFWLKQVLREQLGFLGVIVSDDLTMQAAASVGDYSQRAELALLAGCDLLSVCNNFSAVVQLIDHLKSYDDRLSSQRVNAFTQRLVN